MNNQLKKIYIKNKKRLHGGFQFFMQDFIDVCNDFDISSKPDIFPWYKFHIRAVFKHVWWYVYTFLHEKCHIHFNRKKALIVTANGVTLKDESFPYYASHEIIPMLWDVWPSTWERMYASFKLLDVKMVFVTSSQVADMINKHCKQKAIWIPEGINVNLYSEGGALSKRNVDVFEMGRHMKEYHDILVHLHSDGILISYLTSNLHDNGTLDEKRVKYTNEQLYQLMSDTKVMVCFPQCDTNPERAGEIETLTQRYWEAMLSRCVMVGRAPKELIELIGYNPVIEVDWSNARNQLVNILQNIGDNQHLVDKNLVIAKKYASWNNRMAIIIKALNKNGYSLS